MDTGDNEAHERELRELCEELANQVAAGELTEDEANDIYCRKAEELYR